MIFGRADERAPVPLATDSFLPSFNARSLSLSLSHGRTREGPVPPPPNGPCLAWAGLLARQQWRSKAAGKAGGGDDQLHGLPAGRPAAADGGDSNGSAGLPDSRKADGGGGVGGNGMPDAATAVAEAGDELCFGLSKLTSLVCRLPGCRPRRLPSSYSSGPSARRRSRQRTTAGKERGRRQRQKQ
jgi:hypothetical protein